MPATNFTAMALGGPSTALSADLDIGYGGAYQFGTIVQNSTTAVSVTHKLPKNSRILAIVPNTTTAFDSVTSATFSAGTAAGGTTYVSGVDLKATAGRLSPVYTGAQLLAMENITTNTTVVVTATPVGATTAGRLGYWIHYIPGNN